MNGSEQQRPYWFPDLPGAIAVIMVLSVVLLAFMLAIRDPGGDMFKFMVGGMMTVGFASIMAYYYGSSSGSKTKDDAIIGQMAPAKNPPNPPVETEVHYWDVLTDSERAAISNAAPGDPKLTAFMVAAQTGRASSSDLAYLVVKGFLSSERAAAIQAA